MITMPEDEKLALDAQKAENKAIDELNDRFKASVRETVSETDWEAIERRLQAQMQADEVADAISWQGYNPSDLLESTFSAASEISAAHIADVVAKGSSLSFELTDPNALKWLEKYGADEIKYLSDSQREAIKKIVTDGYRDGATYQQQARQIRDSIGLDPRRAEVLQKYSDNLFSKGKSEAEVWRLMEKKGMALLNQRARNIAVQEATTAGARGFYETTLDACSRGILDPNIYEAYRIVTGDERLCLKCSGLAGEMRQLPDQAYQSSGNVTPKLHHLCRCVEGIRGIKMKRQAIKKIASGEGTANVVFDCQALKRKDGVLYVPTVPLVEGVYEQWGFRVLRSYAEFSQSSHWLHGIPIVVNHEEVTPEARRVGQLFDVQNKPEGFKTAAISRFYEIDCTQRELEALLSGQPHDGSLRWSCFLEDSSGEWTDPETGERKQYDYKEVGPYTFVEYSFVKHGVIGTNDGAGFNMQCKGCKPHSQSLAPGGADSMSEETERDLKQRMETLEGKVATLEQEKETLKGELKTFKDSDEAKQELTHKERFVGKLKPAFLEKAEEHWQECKTIGYLAFEAKHPEMIIQPVQERKLRGSAMTGEGGSGWDLETERTKAKEAGKVI